MKATTLIIALSLLTASSVSGMVLAHQYNQEGSRHERGMQHQHSRQLPLQRALASLALTEEQQAQIQQLMQQHRATKAAWQRDNSVRQQLDALLAAEHFDEVAARQLLEQQQQQRLEQRLAQLKLRHEMLQVLTAEQRAQLAEKQHEKRQKWQHKKQPRDNS